MKTSYLICTVLITIVCGCTAKLEVPEGKVAVTFNRETGEVSEKVLNEGRHDVSLNTVVVFYDLKPSQTNLSFDFLYKDVSEGQITFSIKFKPRVDSLSEFYKEHKTDGLSVAMRSGIKADVRDLMSKLSPEEANVEAVFKTIKDQLTTKSEVNRFIEIIEFVPGSIKVTQPNK